MNYLTNPKLNLTLYRDYLVAQDGLSRMDYLRMIVRRTKRVLAKKVLAN